MKQGEAHHKKGMVEGVITGIFFSGVCADM